jgi:deazaflavin-dependent oxidoreductase (nitroreductase family)
MWWPACTMRRPGQVLGGVSAKIAPMPISETLFSTTLRAHAALYERSDGRIGHRLLGVPTLLLRTKGRRSGLTRTNALVYATDGDRYLVVPSNGGRDNPSAWLHNLRADSNVEVQIGRQRRPATATVIERGDPDFDSVWKAVNDNNKNRYDAYQEQTSRQIPVVALTPASAPAAG